MVTDTSKSTIPNGAEFLIKESIAQDTFSPEDFTEEQLMIRETVEDFNNAEVYPQTAKIEKQENDIAATILEKFGVMVVWIWISIPTPLSVKL